MSAGKKNDSAKPDFRTLLTYQDYGRIGRGPYAYGAEEYGDGNFLGLFEPESGDGMCRILQATGRHIVASLRAFPPEEGKNEDPDTGEDHRYHALAEILMALQWLESDDVDDPDDTDVELRAEITELRAERKIALEDLKKTEAHCELANQSLARKNTEWAELDAKIKQNRPAILAEKELLAKVQAQVQAATLDLQKARERVLKGDPCVIRHQNVLTLRLFDVGPNMTCAIPTDKEIGIRESLRALIKGLL
jgi:hypothetical protein